MRVFQPHLNTMASRKLIKLQKGGQLIELTQAPSPKPVAKPSSSSQPRQPTDPLILERTVFLQSTSVPYINKQTTRKKPNKASTELFWSSGDLLRFTSLIHRRCGRILAVHLLPPQRSPASQCQGFILFENSMSAKQLHALLNSPVQKQLDPSLTDDLQILQTLKGGLYDPSAGPPLPGFVKLWQALLPSSEDTHLSLQITQANDPSHLLPRQIVLVAQPGQKLSWQIKLQNRRTAATTIYSWTPLPLLDSPFEVKLRKDSQLATKGPKYPFDQVSNRNVVCLEPGCAVIFDVTLQIPQDCSSFQGFDTLLRFDTRSHTFKSCSISILLLSDELRRGLTDQATGDRFDEAAHQAMLSLRYRKRQIIPAFPNPRASKTHLHTPAEVDWARPLSLYPCPEEIQKSVDADSLGRSITLNPWLKGSSSYRDHMHHLLWIEEAQLSKNLREFDLIQTEIERVASYQKGENTIFLHPDDYPLCRIYVPGLAEDRPSLLQGDKIYLWITDEASFEYEGFVDIIQKDSILVIFNTSLYSDNGSKFLANVRFTHPTLQFRAQHRAIDDVILEWCFPTIDLTTSDRSWPALSSKPSRPSRPAAPPASSSKAIPERRPDFQPSQHSAQLNVKQKLCVETILNKLIPQHCPFLLRGAFGCGKTETLVVMIRELISQFPKSKILVCGPVNVPTDAFVQKLGQFITGMRGDHSLFRLNAHHRSHATVPREILAYCDYDQDKNIFNIPPLRELMAKSVIVSTCQTASSLIGIGVPQGHFTHIFIDEACQVLEPAALIPLSLADSNTVVVLTGDEQQIGPHTFSPSATQHGLRLSLLERLLLLPVYKNAALQELNQDVKNAKSSAPAPPNALPNGSRVTLRLVENYRNHPEILALSSYLFYKGTLISRMKQKQSRFSGFSWLNANQKGQASQKRAGDVPILFYTVKGRDEREPTSPSWFNLDEVLVVGKIISELTLGSTHTLQEDIIVVAPYRLHLEKMRNHLRNQGLRRVQVSSVPGVQGQERDVIILSTVRASQQLLQMDRKHNLGFISNPRMLNTALTRARSLLIIVGDPFVLATDSHWRQLLEFLDIRGAYVGPPLPHVFKTPVDRPPVADDQNERELGSSSHAASSSTPDSPSVAQPDQTIAAPPSSPLVETIEAAIVVSPDSSLSTQQEPHSTDTLKSTGIDPQAAIMEVPSTDQQDFPTTVPTTTAPGSSLGMSPLSEPFVSHLQSLSQLPLSHQSHQPPSNPHNSSVGESSQRTTRLSIEQSSSIARLYSLLRPILVTEISKFRPLQYPWRPFPLPPPFTTTFLWHCGGSPTLTLRVNEPIHPNLPSSISLEIPMLERTYTLLPSEHFFTLQLRVQPDSTTVVSSIDSFDLMVVVPQSCISHIGSTPSSALLICLR